MAVTVIGVQLMPTGSGTAQANWNNLESPATTGLRVADLIEVDAGASTGFTLTQNGAFANAIEGAGLATSSPDARFNVQVFRTAWYVGLADDDTASFTIGSLPVGATVTLEAAGCSGNASRDTTFRLIGATTVEELYDVGPIDPVPQPTFLQTTVPASGEVTIQNIGVSTFAYNNGWILTVDTGGSGSATITNLDTDNSVTTYQQADANSVSGFGGPITSGTLGGQAVTIIDGDWQSNGGVVSLRVPGSLATGTFDLVLSDGTDSATLSGVTFTQEYPYEAPYGLVDSNSDWAGQVLTEGSRWKVTTEFSHITYDYVAGAAETPPFGNDINDHAEADVGYSGDDSQERQVIYSDGTTATYTVSVSVGEGGIDVYPFSKSIKYAATKNWTWGKRHPMTSMRVRIFK